MRRIRQTDTTSGGVSILLVVLEWLQLLWIHQYIGKIKFKERDSGGRGGSKSLIICAQQEKVFRMMLKRELFCCMLPVWTFKKFISHEPVMAGMRVLRQHFTCLIIIIILFPIRTFILRDICLDKKIESIQYASQRGMRAMRGRRARRASHARHASQTCEACEASLI